ncbi:MAG TPA: hypothetical protein VGP64_16485 [Polyangia bacterium]|jgi:hypothetical protein
MRSKIKSFVGVERQRASQFPVLALVALLVGCSSGSGNPTGGGGAGGKAGAGGQAGSGGKGSGGAGGVAGTTGKAGAGGASGASGTAGTGGLGGTAGGGTAGGGGVAGGTGTGGAAGSGGVAGGAAGGGGLGGAAGGAGTAGGAGAAGSGQTDAGAVDAGTHPTDAGCQGVDLPGRGVPVGTVATADNSLVVDGGPSYGPSNTIDGDLTTEWVAPTSTAQPGASLTLTFPAPVMISAIRIHADALPEVVEVYSLTTSAGTVPIGSASLPVPRAPGAVLPDIQVTPGLYSNITLSVQSEPSWVGIDEIWLLAAPACP